MFQEPGVSKGNHSYKGFKTFKWDVTCILILSYAHSHAYLIHVN